MVEIHTVPTDSDGLPGEIDDDDLVIGLTEDATLEVAARQIASELPTTVGALYGDLAVDGTTTRRPGWSPTRAVTDPISVLPIAVRAALLRQLDLVPGDPGLALALTESSIEVAHVPRVLTTHDRPPVGPSPDRLNEHLQAVGIPGHVEPGPRTGTYQLVPDADHTPRITVVIPTAGVPAPDDGIRADHETKAVERCLASLGDAFSADDVIIDVVLVVGDEYVGDPTRMALPTGLTTTLVTRSPGPFDFSTAVNLGILAATGDLVLMLNDDTEAVDPGFLRRMSIHLTDPTVGAVGAALTYPDGAVQHVGIIFDDARPLHPFVGRQLSEMQAYGSDVARDVIAVTGACLMARRRDLVAVGGLSPLFPMSFNDGDLCLRLRRSGLRVIVEPAAVLVHHETLTRTPVIDPEEWDQWIHRWGEVTDPWYHPVFHRPDDPVDLRRNVDHLAPRPEDVERLAASPPLPRTARLRSRVHRGRTITPAS